MTCPGGCIGDGGQPKDKEYKGDALREKRIDALYKKDNTMELRLSHENEEIKKLYQEFYGEPLSPLAEQMLHTSYQNRRKELGDSVYSTVNDTEKSIASIDKTTWICKVCGYVYEGEAAPQECPICHVGADMFVRG